MYELPTSIQIGKNIFRITNKGDFRVIFDCFSTLNDFELDEWHRTIATLIIFYEDVHNLNDIAAFGDNIETAIKEMYKFFNCNQLLTGIKTDYKLIDWEKDEFLICAAVNKVAEKEIRAENYIHWWTFMGWYMSIGDCVLSQVTNIRYKIAKGKKLEKYEKEFRKDNPQYFNHDFRTLEQIKKEEEILKLWESE